MTDRFKLIFRGEVLQGQHPAVVRKRLAALATFDEAQLDKLFSGHPVVVKREADKPTAARFQTLFGKAGARLRVVPLETAERDAPAGGGEAPDFEVLPTGSAILRDDERVRPTAPQIDLSGLSVQEGDPEEPERAPAVAPPEVGHLSLAPAGATLNDAKPPPPPAAPDTSHIRLLDES